jgi:mRNA interferase RelE/StbE
LAWIIEYTGAAAKQLKKLDKSVALRLLDFMDHRVATAEDPRALGKSLKGPTLGEYWRYRLGEYRIICSIQDQQVCILVIEIGNRWDVYK